jgi:hypothetical protein
MAAGAALWLAAPGWAHVHVLMRAGGAQVKARVPRIAPGPT